jgi:hypothetical protein
VSKEFDAEWEKIHDAHKARVSRALNDLTDLPVPEPAALPKRTICPCQFTLNYQGEHLLTCVDFR